MAQEGSGRYSSDTPPYRSPGSGTPKSDDHIGLTPHIVDRQTYAAPRIQPPGPSAGSSFPAYLLNRGPYPTDHLVFRSSTLEPELPLADTGNGGPPPAAPETSRPVHVEPDEVPHPHSHPRPHPHLHQHPSAGSEEEEADNMSSKAEKGRPIRVSKSLSRRTRVGQTIIWDRHKTVEEKLGEVNMLLTKMPQGEEDWDAFAPRTADDVESLFRRLTLQEQYSRRQRSTMEYQELLEKYEELVTQVPTYEKQMFKVISVGLSRMATKLGPMRTKEVFEIMEGTASELRWTRVAVSRIIDATDILATFGLGERAYELSMRRDKLPSTVGRFTREHFGLLIALLKIHPEKVYKPIKSLPSGKLRIPTVLFELLGGDEREIQEERGVRPLTIEDIAGVLEVPAHQPGTCYLEPSQGRLAPTGNLEGVVADKVVVAEVVGAAVVDLSVAAAAAVVVGMTVVVVEVGVVGVVVVVVVVPVGSGDGSGVVDEDWGYCCCWRC
ncbi:hypothetical protein BGZ63DRAFT_451672 [Mariannaea sp. PMI_226]|nr:hypothetical protein BGZ63DRAFT_451672 [Mariannaea sp. PMI_226]